MPLNALPNAASASHGPSRPVNDVRLQFRHVYGVPFFPHLAQPQCGNVTKLHKAEIWINETQYRRSIGNIYLFPAVGANGTRSPTWGKAGENTLKATPINWNVQQADGGSICFDVQAGLDIYDVCLGNSNGDYGWWVQINLRGACWHAGIPAVTQKLNSSVHSPTLV